MIRATKRPLVIRNFRADESANGHRASADVDGATMWFESSELELTPAPEAFASAMLLVSLHYRRQLVVEAPVSGEWIRNIEQIFPTWESWWGYSRMIPRAAAIDETETLRNTESALAFSGGVDSFHSLLTAEHHDILVTAHGFDMPLADRLRMAALRKSLVAAAEATGSRSAVIRTNYREHPAAPRGRLWERAHGGLLAAFGHVLAKHVGQFTISSSYGMKNAVPWGSSYLTDPFFSSKTMQILQYGWHTRRESKIPEIAHSDLARHHLRVCWSNSAPTGNCSRCGKCLLTMLALAELGVLDEFVVFDKTQTLIDRLNSTPFMWKHTNPLERIVKRGKLEPKLADAAYGLVRRSRHARRLREMATRLSLAVDRHV